MKLEAKQPLTTEELDAINQALSSEPLLVDSVSLFNRYAKRRGEKDLLVRFEPGLTFQVMKIKREANGQLYAIVFEQSQELYCSLNGTDLVNAFGAEGVEVIESSILWAIKQMHRRKAQEEYDGDPAFGRFRKFLLKESIENASESMRNAKEAFERVGKAFSNDDFRKLFETNITGVSTSAIDRKSGVTGKSADFTIIDDPLIRIGDHLIINEKGGLTVASEIPYKVDDFEIKEESACLDFKGGMVTLSTNKGYRKRSMPPLELALSGVYAGKANPLIMQFRAVGDSRFDDGIQCIEIPWPDLESFFDASEIDLLLDYHLKGRWTTTRPNLYDHNLVSDLPDFGAF